MSATVVEPDVDLAIPDAPPISHLFPSYSKIGDVATSLCGITKVIEGYDTGLHCMRCEAFWKGVTLP